MLLLRLNVFMAGCAADHAVSPVLQTMQWPYAANDLVSMLHRSALMAGCVADKLLSPVLQTVTASCCMLNGNLQVDGERGTDTGAPS